MAPAPEPAAVRVFLSYAWEDDDYRERVKGLAVRLREDGVDARLDAWHADGLTIPEFMGREVRKADRILILCSPLYREKVERMEDGEKVSGVGWEHMLFASAIWNGQRVRAALDVVLFRGTWNEAAPLFESAMPRLDLSDDATFEANYRLLLQRILGKTEKAPPLGASPRDVDPKPMAALRGKTEVRSFLARLPVVDTRLIGRGAELEFLDAAWADPAVNFVQVIAPGGTGKTALVDKWFRARLGEVSVFGWSFYSQGTAENRQTSSDPFFDEIVRWLGVAVPEGASVFGKAEAVAERLRAERVLLVLDGVEPLQEANGELRDKPLFALLQELRGHNAGMVLGSTRVRLVDVPDGDEARSVELDNLAPRDGAEYLRELGVHGSEEELRAAAGEYGNHALALTLLGTYVAEHGGDATVRHEIPALPMEENRQGRHARRVMQRYFEMFEGKAEGDVLRALGYFDRPAEPEALRLVMPEGRSYKDALRRLRKARLILTGEAGGPVDCHPLVREHFAEVMRETAEAEFRAGHGRLYEYYSGLGEQFPDTLEEMAPLFCAIYHGCHAGRHQEALDEVYHGRVIRGTEFYLVNHLGALGADLSLLANFFAEPWSRPVERLPGKDRSWLIYESAFALRAVGRPNDAVEPTRVGAEAMVALEDWRNAARAYLTLGELLSTLGRTEEALTEARRSVGFANRSGHVFEQIACSSMFANMQHQSGKLNGAVELFVEAEKMQAGLESESPILYALQGYQYCDLLLSRGEAEEARRRATRTLPIAERNRWLLAIALDHLTLARAGEPTHFTPAIDGLRQAGQLDYLAQGLLARRTPRDLEEVYRIATRSGMKLHLADYHLAMARNENSREHLEKAVRLIEETGYYRRDLEVEELREKLKEQG